MLALVQQVKLMVWVLLLHLMLLPTWITGSVVLQATAQSMPRISAHSVCPARTALDTASASSVRQAPLILTMAHPSACHVLAALLRAPAPPLALHVLLAPLPQQTQQPARRAQATMRPPPIWPGAALEGLVQQHHLVFKVLMWQAEPMMVLS